MQKYISYLTILDLLYSLKYRKWQILQTLQLNQKVENLLFDLEKV